MYNDILRRKLWKKNKSFLCDRHWDRLRKREVEEKLRPTEIRGLIDRAGELAIHNSQCPARCFIIYGLITAIIFGRMVIRWSSSRSVLCVCSPLHNFTRPHIQHWALAKVSWERKIDFFPPLPSSSWALCVEAGRRSPEEVVWNVSGEMEWRRDCWKTNTGKLHFSLSFWEALKREFNMTFQRNNIILPSDTFSPDCEVVSHIAHETVLTRNEFVCCYGLCHVYGYSGNMLMAEKIVGGKKERSRVEHNSHSLRRSSQPKKYISLCKSVICAFGRDRSSWKLNLSPLLAQINIYVFPNVCIERFRGFREVFSFLTFQISVSPSLTVPSLA